MNIGDVFGGYKIIGIDNNVYRVICLKCNSILNRSESAVYYNINGCIKCANKSVHHQPTKSSYVAMKRRCLGINTKSYGDYGGRGIKVCDRWLESFDNFVADMGTRPDGLTLDRIDVNGNYCPENCRWVDRKTQNINRRSTVFYNDDDEILSQRDLCKKYNINESTFKSRIYKGWSVEDALSKTDHRATNLTNRWK